MRQARFEPSPSGDPFSSAKGEEHRNAEPADKVPRESAWTGGGTAVLVSGRFEVEGAISRVEGDADPTSRPAQSMLTPACLRGRRKLL